MFALKIFGFADGAVFPVTGLYLEDFDFDAKGGLGDGVFCEDSDGALRFGSFGEALAYYNTVSRNFPIDDDGTPNSPLTRSRLQIVKVD